MKGRTCSCINCKTQIQFPPLEKKQMSYFDTDAPPHREQCSKCGQKYILRGNTPLAIGEVSGSVGMMIFTMQLHIPSAYIQVESCLGCGLKVNHYVDDPANLPTEFSCNNCGVIYTRESGPWTVKKKGGE